MRASLAATAATARPQRPAPDLRLAYASPPEPSWTTPFQGRHIGSVSATSCLVILRYVRADDLDPAIGARLLAARRMAGLSQRELAADTGYTFAYVSHIETGQRSPSIKATRAFADRLGVSAAWLETGDDVVDIRMPRVRAIDLLAWLRQHGEASDRSMIASIERTLDATSSPPGLT